MVEEDQRAVERRNEMINELKPFIEQFGFEIEKDTDESFSPWNDDVDSLDEHKTAQTFEDTPF